MLNFGRSSKYSAGATGKASIGYAAGIFGAPGYLYSTAWTDSDAPTSASTDADDAPSRTFSLYVLYAASRWKISSMYTPAGTPAMRNEPSRRAKVVNSPPLSTMRAASDDEDDDDDDAPDAGAPLPAVMSTCACAAECVARVCTRPTTSAAWMRGAAPESRRAAAASAAVDRRVIVAECIAFARERGRTGGTGRKGML